MEKSYLKGIIGALIGGLIATIPWILTYVYANMILAVLAVFVALGALKGYQLMNGKVDKKLPLIITIISVVSITIATLIIIPGLLLLQNDASFTIENVKYLYSNSQFMGAIMKDFLISIVFTFLGISGVIKSIKNQIDDNVDNIKVDLSNGRSKKEIDKLRSVFVNKNAIDENNMISLDDEEGINQDTLNFLIMQKIIVKKENM